MLEPPADVIQLRLCADHVRPLAGTVNRLRAVGSGWLCRASASELEQAIRHPSTFGQFVAVLSQQRVLAMVPQWILLRIVAMAKPECQIAEIMAKPFLQKMVIPPLSLAHIHCMPSMYPHGPHFASS